MKSKVEGSSPTDFFTFFFRTYFNIMFHQIKLGLQIQTKEKSSIHLFETSLYMVKMAKNMWRYSNDARAIIENVYKFCMKEKASGMKLSLAHVWDKTAALTGVSKSTAQKVIQAREKQQEQPQL